jgi:ankyrin repeat protein
MQAAQCIQSTLLSFGEGSPKLQADGHRINTLRKRVDSRALALRSSVSLRRRLCPLSVFGTCRSLVIVKLVLAQHAALLSAVDTDGDTPLHNAARGGHGDIVEYLLAEGAHPSVKNGCGQTARDACGDDIEPQVAAALDAAENSVPAASAH